MEENAHHPLARAIVTGVQKEQDVSKDRHVTDHSHLPGEGVTGLVDGKMVHVGNKRLMERLGLYEHLDGDVRDRVQLWERSEGGTVGFMNIEGEGIVCCYSVADSIRPEAADVLDRLSRDLSIDCVMLTGDNRAAAAAVGRRLGLEEDQIESQLYPEDKLEIVKDMMNDSERDRLDNSNPCDYYQQSLVLMVGDGVNDAPALATAHVGVSMGAGAALALETSDVTLLDSNLQKLLMSIETGRRVNRKIVENVVLSLSIKSIVLIMTLMGNAVLWAAIAADVGAMLLVTINGMSLLTNKNSHSETAGNEGPDAV